MRRADDVVRLWALGELTAADGSTAAWRAFYETGEECFRRLYNPMFDPMSGLYCGQASFIDVHFDTDTYHANGYPQLWTAAAFLGACMSAGYHVG
jgi:hypothetical protein